MSISTTPKKRYRNSRGTGRPIPEEEVEENGHLKGGFLVIRSRELSISMKSTGNLSTTQNL